jgi:FtsP/CotA-like multicopper oxidase with cupredoxin domain
VDAVLIGMGERYDATVTAGDGVFPLVAAAEGKSALARVLLTTASGTPPDPDLRAVVLDRRVGGTWMLHCHNTYHQSAGMMTSLDYSG